MKRWWSANFLLSEFGVGLLAALLVVGWSEITGGADNLEAFLHDHADTLYTVVAPIDAAMLGFILAAAAIIVTAAPADRMTMLRNSAHYEDLWTCFRSAMRFLGLGTIVTIAGLFAGDGSLARVVFFLAVGANILAALRVGRCIWAVNWVIRIFTGPSLSRPAGA